MDETIVEPKEGVTLFLAGARGGFRAGRQVPVPAAHAAALGLAAAPVPTAETVTPPSAGKGKSAG